MIAVREKWVQQSDVRTFSIAAVGFTSCRRGGPLLSCPLHTSPHPISSFLSMLAPTSVGHENADAVRIVRLLRVEVLDYRKPSTISALS